jgi:hypothetical protein
MYQFEHPTRTLFELLRQNRINTDIPLIKLALIIALVPKHQSNSGHKNGLVVIIEIQ